LLTSSSISVKYVFFTLKSPLFYSNTCIAAAEFVTGQI